MSAAADKARYYLEQSVPELRELERKRIFAPEEITAIAKKRSDFEHKINARGSSPADYVQYAEFEINVESLRKKRVKRLGVKTVVHSGQRRIFFVFDRGTRKFPGDVQLWMQSIEYARGQKAYKKLTQMLTNLLRLHPTKPEFWIYAAQFALEENGDMTEARGYMRRGLRFCKTKKVLWLQNFRIELNWIAKIHARRRLLGIEQSSAEQEEVKVVGTESGMLRLPDVTGDAESDEPLENDSNVAALAKLDSVPASSGAIPIAIFDAAMQQFPDDVPFAFKFHEEVQPYMFEAMNSMRLISSHIEHFIRRTSPNSWHATACHIAMAVNGVITSDAAFPSAVRELLARINQGIASQSQSQEIVDWIRSLLDQLLTEDLDPALQKVLRSKRQALTIQK